LQQFVVVGGLSEFLWATAVALGWTVEGNDAMGVFFNRASVTEVCTARSSVFPFVSTVELGRDY
jgi:hypothetical protein